MRTQITVLTCDMCGKDDGNVKEFQLPGNRVIDLCELDGNTLEDVLAPYVEKSSKGASNVRQISSARSAWKGSAYKTAAAQKDLNAKVRAEAAKQGVKVKPRGRVPENVIAAYHSGDWSKLAPKANGHAVPAMAPAATFSDPSAEKALAEAAGVINAATPAPRQRAARKTTPAPAKKAPAKKAS